MNNYTSKIDQHIERFITNVIEYTPRVIGAFLFLIIGMWVINRFAKIATKRMEKRELEVSIRTFVKSLISIGLKIVLIVTVAGMLGIGTTSLVTVMGAAGLAVGLALQGSLSNFAGGVLILIFKPYKVGDTIEVLGQTGTVREIQIFNTILLTGDLKTIILPNGAVSNGTVVNHTKYGTLRSDVHVTIAASNDVDVVKNLLIDEMMKQPAILKNPLPEVTAVRIVDNGVTLAIRPYALAADHGKVNAEVVEMTKRVFAKNQIAMAPVKVNP
jgi:small conductance mechanosensitive channel